MCIFLFFLHFPRLQIRLLISLLTDKHFINLVLLLFVYLSRFESLLLTFVCLFVSLNVRYFISSYRSFVCFFVSLNIRYFISTYLSFVSLVFIFPTLCMFVLLICYIYLLYILLPFFCLSVYLFPDNFLQEKKTVS